MTHGAFYSSIRVRESPSTSNETGRVSGEARCEDAAGLFRFGGRGSAVRLRPCVTLVFSPKWCELT